jgi:hypothetical protein
MDFEFLRALEEDWEPVSKPARYAWLGFYALYFLYALSRGGNQLFMDLVSLPIHEGGHLLFGWFGQTVGIAGGTLLQLGVPLALAVYFVFQRQILGAAFAAFFFFENFLNVGTYMADARAHALPLVTVGDPNNVIHDWTYLFSKLGVLSHDTAIGGTVRFLGWLGMLAVPLGLSWMTQKMPPKARSLPHGGQP